MANLNISEFRATSNNGQSGIGPVLPATASQNVSFTSTAGTSTLLNESTDIIMLVADTACFVKVSEGSPVATTLSDVRIPANYPLYFLVNKPGQTKVSAVL